MGRGDDGHAQAAEDLWQVGGLCIHTQTWLRNTTNALDGTLTVWAVLEVEGQGLANLCVLNLVVSNVAFRLQNLGDVRLELEEGIDTASWCALLALRTRDSMSAIGSVMVIEVTWRLSRCGSYPPLTALTALLRATSAPLAQ